MPIVNGRYHAPRKPMPKAKNHPLVAIYLMVDLIDRELASQGGDWDKVISSLRVLREEPANKRDDGLTYHEMAQFIERKRRGWGAV